jgi:hypothetical protein
MWEKAINYTDTSQLAGTTLLMKQDTNTSDTTTTIQSLRKRSHTQKRKYNLDAVYDTFRDISLSQ